MGNYLKLFENHAQYEVYTANTGNIIPAVSHCIEEEELHFKEKIDYSKQYLTFVAKADGTFKLSGNSVSYSLDNGETWATLESNTDSPTVTTGNRIVWKASLTPGSTAGIGTFSSTAQFDVEGNPMSLLYGDEFKGQTDLTGKSFAFSRLFSGCTNVVSAKNMSLPATTLAENCYYQMFHGCTNLTTTPQLPATTLESRCYYNMFSSCRSLTTAPTALPATTLKSYCYHNMFRGCMSLTTAPELPATTLVSNCYNAMFYNCTSLNYIKCLATDISASNCTFNWVDGVASSGTFVKNSAATWTTTGVDGIPTGWTVQDA